MKTNFSNTNVHLQVVLFLTCWACLSGQCFEDMDSTPGPQRLLAALDRLFRASNRFGIRMLQALNSSSEENAFFSPFSVWSSMILLFLGARGTTEKELEAILGFQSMNKSVVAHSYQSLKHWFTSKVRTSAHTSFTMVNNLFLQKDLRVRNCLLQFLDDHLAYVDFSQSPELARLAINYLVRRETKNRINEILPPFSVRSFTQFIVTSTLYFKGAWLQPFHALATQPRPFFLSHLDSVLVETMSTRDTFLYATSDELQCAALEVPYVGRSLTLVALLPRNKVHGVQILIRSLTEARLHQLMEDMFPRHVLLLMPKFEMEDSYQLSSTLLKMGLRDLSAGALNLTGFVPDRPLEMNALFHKSFIAVDEKGTEAASGSATALSRSSRPASIVEFVLDRPFLFFIRENHSRSILFMGVVRNPRITKMHH